MRPSETYQLPPAGADTAGLEGYSVESAKGEFIGTVRVVLRDDEGTYVVVERGTPPLRNDLRAIPWEDVSDVDHDGLAVQIDPAAVEAGIPLDPDNAIEVGEAEAQRVTGAPNEPARTGNGGTAGPVDRPTWYAALALALAGAFSALGLVIFVSRGDPGWEYGLFAIPAVLFVAAALQGYRFFRHSSEGLRG